MIDWQPIATVPEDRKDGRRLLVWASGSPFIAVWGGACWVDAYEEGELSPTYWADINSPEA